MKIPLKILASLPLAATIALGGFTGEARAQTVVSKPISANASFDECINNVTSSTRFQVIICNQTGLTLKLNGARNDLGNFPIGDVPPYTARFVDFNFGRAFSFAGSHALGDTGAQVQFAIHYPPRRISQDWCLPLYRFRRCKCR